jgi:hypothetical protein
MARCITDAPTLYAIDGTEVRCLLYDEPLRNAVAK